MSEKQKPASPILSLPKLSPTIYTSPSECQSRHAISPRSPVAIAAQVLSHEESIRSTVHMRRAAKAIAFEDECMRLENRRLEHVVSNLGLQCLVYLESETSITNPYTQDICRLRLTFSCIIKPTSIRLIQQYFKCTQTLFCRFPKNVLSTGILSFEKVVPTAGLKQPLLHVGDR